MHLPRREQPSMSKDAADNLQTAFERCSQNSVITGIARGNYKITNCLNFTAN